MFARDKRSSVRYREGDVEAERGCRGTLNSTRRRAFSRASLFAYRREKLTCCSSYKGDAGEIEDLLSQGVDVNVLGAQDRTPLHRAIGGKSVAATELLISKGALVNLVDNAGRAPMHWAAIVGSADCAKVLRAAGAEVNPLTKTGKTPLHMGAEAGNLEFVQYILSVGADTSVKDSKGLTAFELAKKGGHKDVMALVKPAGKGGGCVVM